MENDFVTTDFYKEIEKAHIIIETWMQKKYLPFIKEFIPYTGIGQRHFREIYTKNISWTILTVELLNVLTKTIKELKCSHILDTGCGHGVLAELLRKKEVVVTAVNINEDEYHKAHNPWGEILREDAITHIKKNINKYDTVILSWPPYNTNFGYNIIKNMIPGQYLFYCGENKGGCTGDNDFHNFLYNNFKYFEKQSDDINNSFIQFDGIHDQWKVYKLKGENNK